MRFRQVPLCSWIQSYFRWYYHFYFRAILYNILCFLSFNSIIMTQNKWLVFTKICYYGIEQYITLTKPAGRCLCTVRIIWPYLTPLLSMRYCCVEVCLSLHVPTTRVRKALNTFWFRLIFIDTVFFIFCSLFPTMANISIFLSHWHSHINFKSQFSHIMRFCKECNACNNWWYLCTVLLREITQSITDRNVAKFSVLLLFFEKLPG